MSAPAVTIGRFSATLHDDGSAQPGGGGLEAPLRCVVDGGLALALRNVRLPEGRWCVRRLRLAVALDLDRPGAEGGREWAAAVAAAIERAVREGGADVVHYRHDVDLLADLIAGVAANRTARQWAWQQAGALRPGDPAPAADPRAAVLAALGRAPQHAAAALLRAAPGCGLPALDRLFGAEGWQAVAGLAAVASWCEPGAGGPDTGLPVHARALARTLLAGSVLAGLARSARLRPGPATLAAWAVLAAAEADPGSLHRRPHPDLPGALAEELRAVLGQAAPAPVRDEPGAPPVPAAPAAPAAPVGTVPERESAATGEESGGWPDELSEELPGDPSEEPSGEPSAGTCPAEPVAPPRAAQPSSYQDAPAAASTAWAGLLFLLATAPDAGLPQRALDDPALTARPLRWVLHRLGRELLPEAAPDDPALLALAGLGPARARTLLAAPPPTAPERAAVRSLATAWASATAARLDDATDDTDATDGPTAVRTVAHRTGEVCAEPGWIEVRLSVTDTDLAVRRAGLDLDPGWVPWLGAVVRYVYV
ncbi:hypothetical protein ACPC54_09835 [Kitasatospora sp. NPDC094028]